MFKMPIIRVAIVLFLSLILLLSADGLPFKSSKHTALSDDFETGVETIVDVEVEPEVIPVGPETPSLFKVVIDAGHGGKDPGAPGASKLEEKEYTLKLAMMIFDLLLFDENIEPIMTRSDDVFIELLDRAAFAEEVGADALISLHGNTFEKASVSGTETYYWFYHSVPLANVVHQHLIDELGFRDREVRQENWRIISNVSMPAILVEVGYLTNPVEEAIMISDQGMTRTAKAIVKAIKQYVAERS